MKLLPAAAMLFLAVQVRAFGGVPIYRGEFVGRPVMLAQAPAAAPSAGPTVVEVQGALTTLQNLSSGPWTGRLDLTKDFAVSGWQSLKSADEAYGVSKNVWSLQKGSQPLLNIGLFVGFDKPLVPLASSSPRLLAGATIAVPGSTLDWALGTKMGDQWVPALKTGILCAYDVTRPKALKAVPDFVGVGAAYHFALGSAGN